MACLLAVPPWLAYWLVTTRYAMLDDALIHLQYADMLRLHHCLCFDGVHREFGASSLLYVSLLALLRGFSASALLPKVVSDIAYLCLIATLLALIFKLRGKFLSQVILAELAFCLLSPMGIRWSTDGMETSLTSLSVLLLLVIVKSQPAPGKTSPVRHLALFIYGALLVFLRIELALIVALACLSMLIAEMQPGTRRFARWISVSPPAIGALSALLFIRFTMGQWLPDTAIAKSFHTFSLRPLYFASIALLGGIMVGVGLLLCWAQSIYLRIRVILRQKTALGQQLALAIVENSALFIIIAGSCMRDQLIQGMRYLLWPLIFAIAANAWQIFRDEAPASPVEPGACDRTEMAVILGFACVALCLLPIDWALASRAMLGRSRTFLAMRSAHLDRLFKNQTIAAADVGFISYFTGAKTCDLDGLIDGHHMAEMTRRQRIKICVDRSPTMMFLTAEQAYKVQAVSSLDGWSACGAFDFTNASTDDRHYILVPPDSAERVCSALNTSPVPVQRLISGGT